MIPVYKAKGAMTGVERPLQHTATLMLQTEPLCGISSGPPTHGDRSLSNQSARHPATIPPAELLKKCRQTRTRRSGPGGQHRNRVETAVILTHTSTEVSAEANERRSQADNRSVALFRLRVNLALEVRRKVAVDAPPSDLWQSRCRHQRLSVNPAHGDFPALLSETLDRLESVEWDISLAAELSGISTSQMTRFLKLEPRAFALLNERRRERGLRPLW